MKTLLPAALAVLLLAYINAEAAELPNSQPGATLSGAATSAVFRTGTTSDSGASYGSDFNPNQALRVSADIQVEAQHVGSQGNIFVVAQSAQSSYMQNGHGEFIPWDLLPENLTPYKAIDSLAAEESLTVFDGLAFGPIGVQNASVSFFFAYNTGSNPEEIYYSPDPLVVTLGAYDPLITVYEPAEIIDTVVLDESRDREIPILIYLAQRDDPAPTLLFSHGLGGDRFTVGYLASHWSARGFNVINLQHPGSDTSFYEGLPASEILAAFQEAANVSNAIARVEDVSAVISQLEIWNEDSASALFGKVDLAKIGMSGHSFGARTTMATSGEEVAYIPGETQDPRIKAAVVLSPSPPSLGTAEQAFGDVDLPWLLMTGTLDESVVNDVTPEQRQQVYPALPPGGKYELVLFEGEHHAFTDREINPATQNPRNPAHHPEITALSTAFWEAWLLGDVSARGWLDGEGAVSTLQPGDTWQLK